MNPGELKERITIQQNTPTRDTTGQPVDSWAEYWTCYAKVSPLNGREYFQAQQVNA